MFETKTINKTETRSVTKNESAFLYSLYILICLCLLKYISGKQEINLVLSLGSNVNKMGKGDKVFGPIMNMNIHNELNWTIW